MKETNETNHPTKSTVKMMELISICRAVKKKTSALKYLKNHKAAEKRWPPVSGCTRRGDPAGLDERDTT
jgi:hypothetical protein